MPLTTGQLNRATLARQMLLEREDVPVVEALHRVVALQAQEPPSPYVALWNRIAGFDPVDLDRAFSSHLVVKATLMRVTLHAVAADDYTILHQGMTDTLRAARLNDRRFRASGLSPAEADALVPHLLSFADRSRTKEDMEAMLSEHTGTEIHPGVWWALRQVAPIAHHPTEGPWSFGRIPTYVAAPSTRSRIPTNEAIQELFCRYLSGFGPATVKDFRQFSMLRQSVVGPALEPMIDSLTALDGPNGEVLFDVPEGNRPSGDVPAPPRLLGMWDSVLLAHANRTRIMSDDIRQSVIQRNGDVLATVLVDGYVVGVWRPEEDGIEVHTFSDLSGKAWDALALEAANMLEFLAGREPNIYGRYGRWWDELPRGERRVLRR